MTHKVPVNCMQMLSLSKCITRFASIYFILYTYRTHIAVKITDLYKCITYIYAVHSCSSDKLLAPASRCE